MHHNYLFDLDQTLLDFHASEYKGLEIALRANGLPFSDELYCAFKDCNKALWLELEKGNITRPELFTRRFRDLFRRCGADPDALDAMAVNDAFIKAMSENGVLMDGALTLMKRLRETVPDARVYIITNGATINARGRIASTGLDRYLDGLFISEDLGVVKPSKAYFDVCLRCIGEPKETCIVVGDSLTSDMLGAKNAGLRSVWFMPSGDVEQAEREYGIWRTASSFDELYGVLTAWAKNE